MEYYAHVSNDGLRYQTVAEHLKGTASLCRAFAAVFDAGEYGELAGLAHDMGKCTEGFQNRLLHDGPKVDHATAGALCCDKLNFFAAVCVAGHHTGLPDVGNQKMDASSDSTFFGKMKRGTEQHYLEQCGESGVVLPPMSRSVPPVKSNLQASFWIRMLYSCLVDADFLDTEAFMNGDCGPDGYDDMETLLARLEAYIAPWRNPKTELNRLRCEILNTCMEAGSKPKGVYTLTVPTGGGKTVASLAFALRHAAAHGMQRVIYVIPYTSIIEQNAQVFRDILGEGNVLEHHANISFDLSDGAPPGGGARALATENWDMPVVVTTAVQLFESLYANRSSKCRKLHNLANSVIIFDEAQMLPLPHLRPCVAAMASLAEQFHSTVVLCTATQPSLDDLLRTYAPSCPVTELYPQTAELHDRFRRVKFRQAGTLTDEALAEQLSGQEQVLCIVNRPQSGPDSFCPAAKRGQLSPIHADGAGPAAGAAERNTAETEGGAALPGGIHLFDRSGRGCGFPGRCTGSWQGWILFCRRRDAATGRGSVRLRRASYRFLSGRSCRRCCSARRLGRRGRRLPENETPVRRRPWTVIFAVSGT